MTHYFVSLLSPLSLSPLSPRKKQNRKWPLLATSTSATPSRKRPPGPRSGTNRNTRSQRVRRERKRQTGFVVRAATTTRAKKKLKLELSTPPPPKKKKPKQVTAPTPASSPPLASTASLRRRSPARGPRRRCERWAPSALPCRPRRPPRRKTLLLLLLLPPPGPASPSAPRRASPAPRSSRGRRLWERREEGNELIMTYNRWKEVKEKGRGVKEKRG